MFDDDDPVLGRLRTLALAFPDAAEKVSHGIPAFYTTKVFAYYGGSVKVGDGYERRSSSVLVLADPVEAPALLDSPGAYFPMYPWVSGWVGIDLVDTTDWSEIGELVETSYRLTAGVRRVRRLDQVR